MQDAVILNHPALSVRRLENPWANYGLKLNSGVFTPSLHSWGLKVRSKNKSSGMNSVYFERRKLFKPRIRWLIRYFSYGYTAGFSTVFTD
jgi:hypothetical protein